MPPLARASSISTRVHASLVVAVGHSLNPNATVNLTLGASERNITNAGTVTTSGALTLLTGSGNLTNNGLIASAHSDINITAPSSNTDINISAKGGSFQAPQGNINVRDASYNGAANINLSGGNYSAQNINLNSGTGAITGSIGQTDGKVNSNAGAIPFVCRHLHTRPLGNNKESGDPTWVSVGNIDLDGAVSAGESISIIAQGNISIPASANVSIATTGGTDADITLIAGATIAGVGSLPNGSPIPSTGLPLNGAQTASVSFTNANGGSIDLATNNSIKSGSVIDASNSTGNVTLAAFSNGSVGTGTILADRSRYLDH